MSKAIAVKYEIVEVDRERWRNVNKISELFEKWTGKTISQYRQEQ